MRIMTTIWATDPFRTLAELNIDPNIHKGDLFVDKEGNRYTVVLRTYFAQTNEIEIKVIQDLD